MFGVGAAATLPSVAAEAADQFSNLWLFAESGLEHSIKNGESDFNAFRFGTGFVHWKFHKHPH